jgi:hypothetical protein
MDLERYSSLASRVGFFGAFLLLGMAVLERLANTVGYTTILTSINSPGRMLEYAGILLIFVIALLLRQIRDQLKAQGGA